MRNNSVSKNVAAAFCEARQRKGLSQRQLAALADVSTVTVTAIESGKSMPSLRSLRKVAKAMNFEIVIGLSDRGAAATGSTSTHGSAAAAQGA